MLWWNPIYAVFGADDGAPDAVGAGGGTFDEPPGVFPVAVVLGRPRRTGREGIAAPWWPCSELGIGIFFLASACCSPRLWSLRAAAVASARPWL